MSPTARSTYLRPENSNELGSDAFADALLPARSLVLLLELVDLALLVAYGPKASKRCEPRCRWCCHAVGSLSHCAPAPV